MENERGVLLAMTAIVLVVVMALATALAAVLWAGHKSLEKRRDWTQALYFAESSLEYSLVADDKRPKSFSADVSGYGHFEAVVGRKNNKKYPIKAFGIRNGVSDTIWVVVEKKKGKKKNKKAKYRLRSWRED